MATRKAQADEAEDLVDTVETEANGNGNGSYRMSVTVDHTTRRHIRIAAALADMEVGEWAVTVLGRAADKATAEIE